MPGNHISLNKTARAMIINGDSVLLCREKGAKKYFLPGWSVNHGERSEDTLRDNILKDLAANTRKLQYIGGVNFYYRIDRYKSHQQFELVYLVDLEDKFENFENGQVEFRWRQTEKLKEENIFPQALKTELVVWLNSKKVFWASA